MYIPTCCELQIPAAHGHPNTIGNRHRTKRELQTTQEELEPEEENENYKTDFKLTLKSGDPALMEIGKVNAFPVLNSSCINTYVVLFVHHIRYIT